MTAENWITGLGLSGHPEGGWFRETYRGSESIRREHLPSRFDGDRSFSTLIYYLLESGDFSAFHRIRQDEAWHYYAGSALTIFLIDPQGSLHEWKLGLDLSRGELPQRVVPAGWYFAAALEEPAGYALTGCSVAPGFDFSDFELPSREELLGKFPQHREVIERLTRG